MMKKWNWMALGGTLALHVIAVGIGWANSERLKAPFTSAKPIEVALHSDLAVAPEAPQPAEDHSASSQEASEGSRIPATETSDRPAPAVAEDKIVLPPAEVPYMPAADVDVRAQPVSPIIVPFPDAALERPKGTAILVLYVSASGEVERVEIEKSELPPLFERTAVDTFKQARMYPAVKNGIKVKSRMKVLVEFESK